MVFLPHLEEEDKEVAADQRTMREVLRMGNSLNSMIQLTGDCPSVNPNGKMPLLDTQVWVEGRKIDARELQEAHGQPPDDVVIISDASEDETYCSNAGGSEN